MLENLEVKTWLEMNAKLQQKKNLLRTKLKEKGVLPKKGQNDYDHYSYFSEAQYKELFTDLFSSCGLEMKFNELGYDAFPGVGKQSIGRSAKLLFRLFDTETGFYEDTTITGEGMDKGDKAGYKAYTGALKYYLANTFMAATGDDPEKGEALDQTSYTQAPANPIEQEMARGSLTPASDSEIEGLQAECQKKLIPLNWIYQQIHYDPMTHRLTKEEYGRAMNILMAQKG